MIIRKVQMQALQGSMVDDLAEDMKDHLREHFAEEIADLDDDALHAQVETSLTRAKEHGLTARLDCQRYFSLAAAFGWDFDQESWVSHCLSDEAEPPSDRLRRVKARYLRQLRAEVQNEQARAAFGL